FHAEANGNVAVLISALGYAAAKYGFDPFGNMLSRAGDLGEANPYRFSSKEREEKSGIVYFLYRYYNVDSQRWPNCDPLGEPGFAARNGGGGRVRDHCRNLYQVGAHDAVSEGDYLGLDNPGCDIGQPAWRGSVW